MENSIRNHWRIKITGRLLVLSPRDEQAGLKLIEEVKEAKEVTDKGWLLRSIEEKQK